MSELETQAEAESQIEAVGFTDRLLMFARQTGRSAMTLGVLVLPTGTVANPPGIEINFPKPKTPDQLTAGKPEVPARLGQELSDASWMLVSGGKDANGKDNFWHEGCTVVNIRVPGLGPAVEGVGHCVTEATGAPATGTFKIPGSSAEAMNFINASPFEFAVVDPRADRQTRDANPIAKFKSLVVDTNYEDVFVAQLDVPQLDAARVEAIHNSGGRTFADFPAIEYKPVKEVIPGTKIKIAGLPAVNHERPTTADGILLGRITLTTSDGVSRKVDIAVSKSRKICHPGNSGGGYITPTGQLGGGLTFYGEFKSTDPAARQAYANLQKIIQAELGIQISGSDFPVACGFSVPPGIEQLEAAISVPAPKTVPKQITPKQPSNSGGLIIVTENTVAVPGQPFRF